ncbi:MAG: iron-sulfur cluster assembly accessory protein [Candidatus Midichloria sp.]|nr:MAG: iron-sulfur cluster assembly accessory protein [Candidatus Midichloria sp.]
MLYQDFTITQNAEHRIKELLVTEVPDARFRIKVLGGGCSGFKYDYKFDSNFAKNDKFFANGLVVIDELSLTFLMNSVLDYYEDLGGASFVVKNPNTSAKCGCGNSFFV